MSNNGKANTPDPKLLNLIKTNSNDFVLGEECRKLNLPAELVKEYPNDFDLGSVVRTGTAYGLNN